MSNDDQNKINISKEEIFSGRIKDETVSEMAKMTAKQVYWQGYNAGVEMAAAYCDKIGETAIGYDLRVYKK